MVKMKNGIYLYLPDSVQVVMLRKDSNLFYTGKSYTVF